MELSLVLVHGPMSERQGEVAAAHSWDLIPTAACTPGIREQLGDLEDIS